VVAVAALLDLLEQAAPSGYCLVVCVAVQREHGGRLLTRVQADSEVVTEWLAAYLAAFDEDAFDPGAWARRVDQPAFGDGARRVEFVFGEDAAEHRFAS
jgi:hypothetical protein